MRPPGGLVAARFRNYEARSGMPLLQDRLLLLSVKGQRLDGTWGSIHITAPHESFVAASALLEEELARGKLLTDGRTSGGRSPGSRR